MNQAEMKLTGRSTQTEDLLEYLKTNKTITPLEALYELGIFRLAARVKDIENKYGYRLPREFVSGTAKNGRRYSVMQYGGVIRG